MWFKPSSSLQFSTELKTSIITNYSNKQSLVLSHVPGNGPDSGKQVHHAESLSSKDESEIWSTGIPVTILNSLFWNNWEFWEKMKEEYYLHALYPDFQFLRYYHSCFIFCVLSFMCMYIILIEFISFQYLWFIYTNITYICFFFIPI